MKVLSASVVLAVVALLAVTPTRARADAHYPGHHHCKHPTHLGNVYHHSHWHGSHQVCVHVQRQRVVAIYVVLPDNSSLWLTYVGRNTAYGMTCHCFSY